MSYSIFLCSNLFWLGVKNWNDQYFGVLKFLILKEQNMSYSFFFYVRIYFLFQYLLKLFEHSKYII